MFVVYESLSVRRAWIEMQLLDQNQPQQHWSLSVRRAWIEMFLRSQNWCSSMSLSVRRAWIEICSCHYVSGGIIGRSP